MRLSLPTVFAASIVIHAVVAQADVVTATNMDGGYIYSNEHIPIGYTNLDPEIGYTNLTAAQGFIPTVSGTLTTVTASVYRFAGGEPLQVSISAGADGIPGTDLGTLSLPAASVPAWQVTPKPAPTTFDLSSLNILLVAGQSYFVVFQVDTAADNPHWRYRAHRTEYNDDSFGIPPLYYRLDANDPEETGWRPAPHYWPDKPVEIGLIVSVVPSQEVQIDVDPDSEKNRVNLKTKRPKPLCVAVLGDADLDVLDVMPDTARFGDPELTDPELGTGAPVAPTGFVHDDVDGDGDLDLLLQFDVAEMKSAGAVDGDSLLMMLEAELLSGGRVFGFDLINQKTNNGKGRGGR